jgi:hypothetical protein
MGLLGEMDALEMGDRCPAPIRGQLLAEVPYTRPLQLGLLIVGFFAAVRLRRLFRALARTFRSSYVVGVLIGFLHRE